MLRKGCGYVVIRLHLFSLRTTAQNTIFVNRRITVLDYAANFPSVGSATLMKYPPNKTMHRYHNYNPLASITDQTIIFLAAFPFFSESLWLRNSTSVARAPANFCASWNPRTVVLK